MNVSWCFAVYILFFRLPDSVLLYTRSFPFPTVISARKFSLIEIILEVRDGRMEITVQRRSLHGESIASPM